MITLLNAKENNLKSIKLNLPENKLIVVTGVSGSGKSTLVYVVLFQEARRRYLETFSSNARLFMGKLNQPDVQYLSGLSPAIALQQKSMVNSPRATVGTLTEVYDLLRLLFARVGSDKRVDKSIPIDRSFFSFNTPKGACEICSGLGVNDAINPDLLIQDANKSIREGAFAMTTPSGYIVYSQVTMDVLNQVCQAEGFSVDIPWKDLTQAQKRVVLFGSKKITVPFGKHPLESRMKWSGITAKPREESFYKGIIPVMEEILKRDRNPNVLRFANSIPCKSCGGSRLKPAVQQVLFGGKNLVDLSRMTLLDLAAFFETIALNAHEKVVAEPIIQALLKTIRLVNKVGLGFLTLNRSAQTLSGSETQRLRLAKVAASGMRGLLYVFDEPSTGMHPTETRNLMEVLFSLRDAENTVLLVEHNPQVIQYADWIVDLGPGAGENGGHVLFSGKAIDFFNQKTIGNSETLKYFKNPPKFKSQIRPYLGEIVISGAKVHNLQNVQVAFKTGALNVITGISGSGKTSLVHHVLGRYFKNKFEKKPVQFTSFEFIEGDESIKKLIEIDQSSIGKTPRSNAATYTGLSEEFRNLFARLPQAKVKQLTKNHFSFNTPAGRCPKCAGAGYEQIGMHLLGNVELVCSECNGKQFKDEVLSIHFREKNLAEIYAMTIDEASNFFSEVPKIMDYLHKLQQVGLGYLTLNQRSSSLSGGEARRVKLAKQLVKTSKESTLFIIDEPASGLHPYDVDVLLKNLNQLVDQGHTVVLVEQSQQIIKQADYLIELGPGSGDKGGKLVYQGKPSGIEQVKGSPTAQALTVEKEVVETSPKPVFERFGPIELRGVSTNNLKQVDVDIPFNKLTVITGISGSGKSSLAFDTLFAEGRQQYAESFSAYVRNRLNINSQARYESILGLMPTLAINQQSLANNERSTVGTITDIYDTIRLLFARVGKKSELIDNPLSSWFSFNHEQGACPQCQGLGFQTVCDSEKLISDTDKALIDGAMNGSKAGKFYGDINGQYIATLKTVGEIKGFDFSKPWNALSSEAKKIALEGTGDQEYLVEWNFQRKNRKGSHQFKTTWPGFLKLVNDEFVRKANDNRANDLLPVMKKVSCYSCQGGRLNNRAMQFTVLEKDINEWLNMPVMELSVFLKKQVVITGAFSLETVKQKAAQILVGKILNGLDYLIHLGLGYLSLSRRSNTLSGGEGQRVRLASALNQDLSGVCLVLDEPTRGLHSRDTENLIFILQELKRQGNTLVVCEHDPYFINSADHIIELGPGAGKYGGHIIAEGLATELVNSYKSLTGPYLRADYRFKREKRPVNYIKAIQIKRARANNLKNIDVRIPANALVVLSGVSGSGKSSLLHQVIHESIQKGRATNCDKITGLGLFDQGIYVDQNLSKTHAQSMVIGFLNSYESLKKDFVKQAKQQGIAANASQFSLYSKTAACVNCGGKGEIKTSLDFLSDVYEPCELCNGTGFKPESLNIKVEGKHIADWLDMSFEEIVGQNSIIELHEISQLAVQLGLGYLSLKQRLHTLSGGELQRLKLINSLTEQKGKSCLFLLDEPTTGLHMYDVEKLMHTFDKLLDNGHSLVVIEHHQTVTQSADYLIELGPGAGDAGGNVVRQTD
ncbi:MAG: ATP-binding cassette domain-containing protein [Salinivirgaceae bacterium]